MTVPSFWTAPGRLKSSPPLEKISAISPMATSVSFSSSTASQTDGFSSSCSIMKEEMSKPLARENDCFLMTSSRLLLGLFVMSSVSESSDM